MPWYMPFWTLGNGVLIRRKLPSANDPTHSSYAVQCIVLMTAEAYGRLSEIFRWLIVNDLETHIQFAVNLTDFHFQTNNNVDV